MGDAGAQSGEPQGVCIVHHDDMQLHVPPNYDNIYELPRRVIAIENRLKGLDPCKGFPCEEQFGGQMQVLPSSRDGASECGCAFGSVAPAKRRRMSYSAGQSSKGSVWSACRTVEAPEAEREDLLRVHSEAQIAKVEEKCALAIKENAAFYPIYPDAANVGKKPDPDDLNDDIYYSPDSLRAMKRAAGGAVQSVRELFRTDANSGRAVGRSDVGASFAIVRPPGHHCCDAPFGFCFFNNTAIAAAHAKEVLGLSRVAVVDWDYHHGDGTQKLFYEDPSVLAISLHVAMTEDGLAFPQCKDMDITFDGKGPGRGYNINIPWPTDQVGLSEYEDAFNTVVMPALQGFKPELILVASGFDAVQDDILAGTRLPARGYYNLTQQLLSLNVPVAVILEGGYAPALIAEGALNVVHALLKLPPPAEKASAAQPDSDDDGEAVEKNSISVTTLLDALRRRLNTLSPWKELSPQYFKEADNGGVASKTASKLFSARIAQLLDEEEVGTSYYKQIGGIRYDRALLEKADLFARDGQISFGEAKDLWESAQDGKGVTLCEKQGFAVDFAASVHSIWEERICALVDRVSPQRA
eukprot:TRINITY_DN11908_c0_g2_i1.p1 TRINITY_DN11908_c0_g2~~TRINITY_DN11908_c0_g2_i1.p1  ORF type:complete len:582 (+),score=94.32 TRINITY_DN11908_c0_g2_i1:60-1805(+)